MDIVTQSCTKMWPDIHITLPIPNIAKYQYLDKVSKPHLN